MGLDLSTIPMKVVINIANIVVLFVILWLLVYKPVKKFMDKRSESINKELLDARQKHDEAENEQRELAQTLAQKEKDALDVIREKQAAALKQADTIIQNAKAEADSILKTAREQAQLEHQHALIDLKDDVAALAVDIARQLLKREIQQEDNDKIVDEFFKEVK